MHRLLFAAAIALPASAYAVGSDDSNPPTPTQTTTVCEQGQVWDAETKACVDVQGGLLDDGTLYRAAREFAYAGRYGDALAALAAMSDPNDDRVLTYKGFAHRKLGDATLGMAYYRQALERNPDNLLARSYMGQGLAEAGDQGAARAQLSDIRRRGGRGTWAEVSLRMALETGRTHAY